MAAESPQKNVAAAMKMKPRSGCVLLAEKLSEAFRVVPDEYFVSDDDGWRRLAVVLLRQLPHYAESGIDAAFLEHHAALS
jgi:hypothetical protein